MVTTIFAIGYSNANKAAVIAILLMFVISSFISVPGNVSAATSGNYGYTIINNGTAAEMTSYAGAEWSPLQCW